MSTTTSSGPPAQYTPYQAAPPTAPPAVLSLTAHYPNHYPNVPVQPTSTYYSPYTLGVVTASGLAQPGLNVLTTHDLLHRQTNPAPARPSSPPSPGITPTIASRALERLLENELVDAGFESVESQTSRRFEIEVITFIQQLFERAHEYANLANRAGVIPPDLLLACDDFGIAPKDLYPLARKRRMQTPVATTTESDNTTLTPSQPSREKRLKRKSKTTPARLIPPTSRSPSPDLLTSDDESGPPVIPTTLRGLPPYFPQLPPKHTYLQTPASPPKKAALPSLEKKLKTAGLVQESLKNLLLATEDSTGQEDAELLGHIVNWEAGLHPRKRWRVGR